MRSHRRRDPGQDALPFAVPDERRRPTLGPAASGSTGPAAHLEGATGLTTGLTTGGTLVHRLATDVLASRGWPAGTELLVARGRRPQRGEVALVIDRGRRIVGEFGLELGRLALRTDRGSHWLGPSTEVLGVVVQADAPLC